MRRRNLLVGLSLSPLLRFAPVLAQTGARAGSPTLLLIELNGGNDSLNTIIPLEQLDAYRSLRPRLGLAAEDRIALDSAFAWHRALEPLLETWRAGELALVHGLGYPHPSRSHFRAVEIWDTASAADEYLEQGWLAAPARSLSSSGMDALVFGRNAAALAGGGCRFLSLESLDAFLRQSGTIEQVRVATDNPALRRVIDAQKRIQAGHQLLSGALSRSEKPGDHYPAGRFGRQLADAARVIRANLGVPVLKVALGSFDTHRNQKQTHARLLRQLAEGVVALRSDLTASGHWERVLVMTYSEFGRRAAENGSGGTDHGTAATHFIAGGRVLGGHYGEHPSLAELDDRDMRFTTDFRRLYQTVLSEWWRRPDLQVPGGDWKALELVV